MTIPKLLDETLDKVETGRKHCLELFFSSVNSPSSFVVVIEL